MADRLHTLQDLGTDLSMGTSQLPGRDVLDRTTLRVLNIRSDRPGVVRFFGHCLIILVTGGLVYALREEWNLPYHAEHHLYPSLPFHALPQAHGQIRTRLAHLDTGYIAVNRAIVQRLARPQWE